MKSLKNHPEMWLRDDAADSLERLERDHGIQKINSAARTVAQQENLLRRYAHPMSVYDRPPYLYAPAPSSGPNKSRHIDGKAIDADSVASSKEMWAEYGFEFLFPYDKIHVEYNPATDRHRFDKATNTEIKETLEMAKPTLITSPSGIFVSVGGAVANMGSSKNVEDFQEKNKGKYDGIWLPDSVVRQLRS